MLRWSDCGTIRRVSRCVAVLLVLLSALLFSTTGTARALADVDADALSVGASRVLIGGGVLGLVGLLAPAAPLVRAEVRPRVPAWAIVAFGTVGVLAYQPTFFAGTRLNGVAVGTVVALGSAPIASGILDAVLRRRRPGARWVVATGVALVGVVLVSGLGTAGAGAVGPLGTAASLGAGLSYACYAVAGKLLIDRGWSSLRAMGAMFGTAAACSVPILFAAPVGWILTPRGAALALWLGLAATAAAYALFGAGLRVLAPTTVSTLTLAEPLGATLLGLLVLREQLSPVAAAGLVVIAAGLALVTVPTRRRSPVAAAS